MNTVTNTENTIVHVPGRHPKGSDKLFDAYKHPPHEPLYVIGYKFPSCMEFQFKDPPGQMDLTKDAEPIDQLLESNTFFSDKLVYSLTEILMNATDYYYSLGELICRANVEHFQVDMIIMRWGNNWHRIDRKLGVEMCEIFFRQDVGKYDSPLGLLDPGDVYVINTEWLREGTME